MHKVQSSGVPVAWACFPVGHAEQAADSIAENKPTAQLKQFGCAIGVYKPALQEVHALDTAGV